VNLSVNNPRFLLLVVAFVICTLVAVALVVSLPDGGRAVFDRTGVAEVAGRLATDVVDRTTAVAGPLLSRAGLNPSGSVSDPAGSAAPAVRTAPAPAAAPSPGPRPRQPAAPAPAEPWAPSEPWPGGFVPGYTEPETPTVTPDVGGVYNGVPWTVDPQVYTSDDADIVPPRPLQPLLARDAPRGIDPESLGVVVFLVDQRGEVASLDLVQQSDGINDSMLLAAIKNWRFEPALKDGRPVKYRLTMRVTQ
jgi:hypothetical protein